MPTSIHRKLRAAAAGELPTAILRLPSGWLIAGDTQPLRGYCMLLADPPVQDFNALDEPARARYALDMGLAGDALLRELGAARINYETWGNLEPALHTHIVPRYSSEPPSSRVLPPRQAYAWNEGRAFDPLADGEWVERVRLYLRSRLGARA